MYVGLQKWECVCAFVLANAALWERTHCSRWAVRDDVEFSRQKEEGKKNTQAAKLRQQMHHSLNLLHSFDQPSSGKTYENIPVVVVILMAFKDIDRIFPK